MSGRQCPLVIKYLLSSSSLARGIILARIPSLKIASSFGLNSFYGGSKGRRDSSSTDSDLNCVKTRRKAGQPPVSQNKGKKGRTSSAAGGHNIKQKKDKSELNENVSLNSTVNTVNTISELLSDSVLNQVHKEIPLSESALEYALNDIGVGNVLGESVLGESGIREIAVGDALNDSALSDIGVGNVLSECLR